MGDFNFSMPSFEVYKSDTVCGVLPKLYRFEPYPGLQTFDYYVAEYDGSSRTLVFKGTNTAPDGVTTWDATNTGDRPAWYDYAYKILYVVFDETFAAAKPTSCARWFDDFYYAISINGVKNLNTLV